MKESSKDESVYTGKQNSMKMCFNTKDSILTKVKKK